jgi:DNA-binding transcriptional regulator YiaG
MKRNFKGFLGLGYIDLHGVPVVKLASGGEGMHAQVRKSVEIQVARAIISSAIPLRGREVAFLRSVLGLSQRALGELLGYSDVAILKWERAASKRLDLPNEIAVKVLLARRLGISVTSGEIVIDGAAKAPKHLVVQYDARGAATRAA